jgi:NCS1 family nucleobase:cation symporter-1
LTYFSYQSSVGIIIVCWSTGASLLGFGLNAWQAILDVIIGYTCVGLLTMLGSQIGGKWHIGFPVANRYTWGMRGNVFPVLNRVVLNCTWFATESWLGSMCT